MESVKSTSIPKINTAMGMTKEQYEEFSKARCRNNNSVEKDDDLFGKSLDLSSNMEDNYVWSVYGQCWLPK